ncbi:DUF4118 domain-containing protein [Methylocystis sp. IM2]|uniref:DUF4118 domain-containing protein n=1 Tax=Methylocystis sp. IM2 TaxID=3136563 RepID=UPI0030FC9F60
MAFMVARQRPAVAYAVAIGAVALAAWIRLTASDWFIEGVPFLTFFPAVLVATVVGGLGAGLFAAACSVGVAWYFFWSHRSPGSSAQRQWFLSCPSVSFPD